MCLFSWLAARGVILMVDNLRNRRVTCVSWRIMCNSLVDTNHLLLHCWRAFVFLAGNTVLVWSSMGNAKYS